MSEAEKGVGQQGAEARSGLKSRHEPPRVCRTDRVKNVGPHPGKHGGRHYAVSNARTRVGVTDGVFSNSGVSLKRPGIGKAKRVDPL